MEAISVHPYKNSPIKNPRQIQLLINPFCPMDNFFPPHFHPAGLLHAPPSFLSRSYPPYSLPPQPPLLPLPPAANLRRSGPDSVRGQSCPPSNKKGGRIRDASITPKKSKYPRREQKNSPKKSLAKTVSIPSIEELPRPGVARVLPLNLSSGNVHADADNCIDNNRLRFDESKLAEDELSGSRFSGSVAFTVSPPPSSLPLPTFSLRPKLGCSAEAAAGIDTGATDNLRRLLRLR